MAGYMTRLQGYVYEGEYKAAEGSALKNGMFANITDGEVVATIAAQDTIMRVHKATTLWGLPAVEAIVVSVGTDEVYFVEQVADYTQSVVYDEVNSAIQPGEYVRMHRMLPGDMAIFSIDANQVATLVAGASIQPAAAGKVAVVSGP